MMKSQLLQLFLLLRMVVIALPGFAGFAMLRCGNAFTMPVDIHPPIYHSSGVLVDWNLFSADEFCSDPPRMPTFKNLFLSEVSLITTCPHCPQCSVVLPQQYELPITTTLERIFLVTKVLPYNRPRTDIRVHYVIVDRLPPTIKNCELVVGTGSGGRSSPTMPAGMNHPPMDWSNLLLVFVVLFAIVIATCTLRCVCGRLWAERASDNRFKYSTASSAPPTRQSSVATCTHKLSTHLDHAVSYVPSPASTLPRKKSPAMRKLNSYALHDPYEAKI